MSRSGVAANPNMDNLSYKYDYYNNNPAEGLRSNRLYHVNDAISSTGYDDIQDQGSFVPEIQSTSIKEVNTQNNYGYDELGNLVRDNQEEIATITWTVSGKIKSVTRTGGSTQPNLEFVYDPMGNRIAKIETPNPYVATEVKTTFYGRDAQGNHLVTYDHHWNPNTSNEYFLLDERIMYGSKRLGMQDFNDSIYGPEDVPPVLDYYERNLGRKKYEGTNHLGNVLAVYSDKKLPKDDITPGGAIDYYEADIHGAYDYYSFGSPMPDRTFVPEACSTQTLVINNYTYQDNFPNPVPLWNPVGGAAIGWAGPGAMTVNCNIPNEGVQQALPCMPGVQNTLDLTLTFGNNDIQIMLLDPLTLLPLPGYPILYPAQPFGTVLNIQLFFIGPPAGNVIVQITSPGGPFPYPDMFMVNYAAISTQTTLQQQVCWDEDYRFGFNGMEKDNEAKGQGNSLDFGARIYDSRLGRWLSVDPSCKLYPSNSPYHFATNSPIILADENGKWARDQNGNIIITLEKTEGWFAIGGTNPITGITTLYAVKGTYGYVLANNGEKVQVFVPSSNTVIEKVIDAHGNVLSEVDITAGCTGERNCTTNALFPEISSLIISSDQITEDILKAEGYVPGSEIEKNVNDLVNQGDPAASGFNIEDITQKGDIVTYEDGNGVYEHFEIYTSDNLVNTKGGVQSDPLLAWPGKNANFSNPQAWINTNVGGWQDPTATIAGSTGKTSSGLVGVSSTEFDQIQVEMMVK